MGIDKEMNKKLLIEQIKNLISNYNNLMQYNCISQSLVCEELKNKDIEYCLQIFIYFQRQYNSLVTDILKGNGVPAVKDIMELEA